MSLVQLDAACPKSVALDLTPSSHVPQAEAGASVRELWTRVDDCPVRYLQCGAGPPLVLVPGLLGSAFCWRFNLQALSVARTVYALDMPGMGYSGRIAERECSLATNADRLLGFMAACGIDSADLLGSSHGGAVAMMAAALAPTRVRRLILAAPVHPWMNEHRLLLALAASRLGGWLLQSAAPYLGALHGYFLRHMYGDARRIAPGTVQGYSAPLAIPGTIGHLLAMVRCWNNDLRQLAGLLPRLRRIPTLLSWGDRDTAVTLDSAAKLRPAFEQCELRVIAGAGHLLFEEYPEEFNQAVLEFLRQPPGQRILGAQAPA